MTRNASFGACCRRYTRYQSTTFVEVYRLRTLSKRRGVDFPCPNKTIPLFEKLNPSKSINVLAYEESSKGFTVEYRSPGREREHHVNLLLLEDADNPSKQRYVWIKKYVRPSVSQNQFAS